MGNSKSHQLKEEYINKNFEIVLKNKDISLGNYDILDFKGFNNEFYIRKIIDPQDYDRFADINEFVKNLSKTDSRICDFFFVEFNQKNPDMFDLIFEYGVPININKIESEKELLVLIKSIIKAMEFLHNNNMHYPLIHKNFLMTKKKNYYKLMNPYCFKDYLKDVLEIYMNPMNSIKLKKEFCEKQIKRNVKEFGKMLMCFMNKFDEKKIYDDESYREESLKLIDENGSFLMKMIHFVFKQNGPENFHDIKIWFDKNLPEENSVFKSFLTSGLKLLGKKEDDKKKQNKEKSPEIVEPVPKSKKQYTIFGNDNEKKDPNLLSNLEIGVEIQEESKKEEKENFMKYKENLNKEKKRSQTISSNDDDNYKPRISNPELNFNNIEDEFYKPQTPNPTNFFPDQNVRTTNFESMDKIDFFEQSPNLKKGLKRKKSLNKKPLIGNLTNNIEFLNQNSSGTNITNYLKVKEKRKSNSAFNDLEGYYINEVDDVKKNNMEFANYLSEEYSQKEDVIIENKIVENLTQQENQTINMFKKKTEEEKKFPQKKSDSIIKNDFQPPISNRKIKRVLLKWVKAEGKYQKTIEYSDGTTEIVEINEQENDKYKNSIKTFNRPVRPKENSVESNIELTSNRICFNFLLYPTIELPPILLFTSNKAHVNKMLSNMKSIVDNSKRNRPSRYHIVEEEGMKPAFEGGERLRTMEPKKRHIIKAFYESK